jgi:hypothetical protein
MISPREHATQLRQEAITLLLKERDAIDVELEALGYGKEKATTFKRRGRPPKTQPIELPDSSRSETTQSTST